MSQKLDFKVRVKKPLGLHTRPATYIVKLLQSCKSEVNFAYKKQIVNAKSILSILMLAVSRNSLLRIIINGEDALQIKEKLVHYLENAEE